MESEWTSLNKPLKNVEFLSDADEDKNTKKYMDEYQIKTLQTELSNLKNNVPLNDYSSYAYVWICDGCNREFITEKDAEYHKKFCSSKCDNI